MQNASTFASTQTSGVALTVASVTAASAATDVVPCDTGQGQNGSPANAPDLSRLARHVDAEENSDEEGEANADGSRLPDSAARLARLARKAESARLARLRHKQFVQDKQAEVTKLQSEERALLAEEEPASIAALANVREELQSILSTDQIQTLGSWLCESTGGAPLIEMYLDKPPSQGTSPRSQVETQITPLHPLTEVRHAAQTAISVTSASPAAHGCSGSAVERPADTASSTISTPLAPQSVQPAQITPAPASAISSAGIDHPDSLAGVESAAAAAVPSQGNDRQSSMAGDAVANDLPSHDFDMGTRSDLCLNSAVKTGTTMVDAPRISAAALAHATPESLGCGSWAAAAAMAAAAAAAAATAAANSSEADIRDAYAYGVDGNAMGTVVNPEWHAIGEGSSPLANPSPSQRGGASASDTMRSSGDPIMRCQSSLASRSPSVLSVESQDASSVGAEGEEFLQHAFVFDGGMAEVSLVSMRSDTHTHAAYVASSSVYGQLAHPSNGEEIVRPASMPRDSNVPHTSRARPSAAPVAQTDADEVESVHKRRRSYIS